MNNNYIYAIDDGNTLVFEYQATPATHPNPEFKLTVKSDGVYAKNAAGIEFMISDQSNPDFSCIQTQ